MWLKRTGYLIILSLFFSAFSACSSGDGRPLVLTLEAENAEEYSGWGSRDYFTGISLQEEIGEPAVGNYIYLELYIPMPGRYFPWVLAAVNEFDTTADKRIKITMTPKRADSRSRTDSVEVDIRPTRSLEWVTSRREKRWLEFPDFGSYILTVEGLGDEDVQLILDKVMLTSHPRYAPTGYGIIEDTVDIVLPPAWAFGVLYGGFTDQAQTRQRIDSIIGAGLPIDGYWIDSWFWDFSGQGRGPEGYIDFQGDQEAFPDLDGLWGYMAEQNIKSGIWIWDAIQQEGNEQVFREFETWGFFTGPGYENTSDWHNDGPSTVIADIDFENPEAAGYWKLRMEPLFEQGLDFLKLDRSKDLYFLQTAFEATQELGKETRGRGFVLSQIDNLNAPQIRRYPAKRTGDALTAWSQPGYPDLDNRIMGAYRENVEMVANPRTPTYEAPFLTHDAGGYHLPADREEASDSLYMRWMQFALFNPITTVFSSPENPGANLPFRHSAEALDNFRYYGRLKLQLFPYIYSYAHLTRNTGRKMIQGMAAYPDQYLFGREMLVAPVVERGAGARNVYLPPGQWIDFYDHTGYDGDQKINYQAPADKLPLLVREGSIIPLRPFARSVELGSNDTLELRVYPGNAEEGFFTLFEDDGRSNDYLEGRIASTAFRFERSRRSLDIFVEAVNGGYLGMTDSRFLSFGVVTGQAPVSVSLNGEALPGSAWSYDGARQWLSVDAGILDKTRDHRIRIGF